MIFAPRKTHRITGSWETLVYYEDTDFSGFVYHANYLKFFERAREHLIGIDYLRALFRDGLHFVVRKLDAEFLAPAGHGDRITIATECEFSNSPLLQFVQTASRSSGANSPSVECVRAKIEVVFIDSKGKPHRLSRDVLAHLTHGITQN